MSNDSDERIDVSSLDQMTGPRYIGQAMFAINNSPKSRYDEIIISKRFPLILSTPPVHVWFQTECNTRMQSYGLNPFFASVGKT